jgi:phosphoglycolate phosphatase-like HAD superfamily hydrolase
VWFIGDSLIDLECAHSSGCNAILIGRMTSTITNSKYNPDLYFENHQKILEALKGIL